jgi:hypothetical protein
MAGSLSPRGGATLVGRTPTGVPVSLHSHAGDLASPRQQFFDSKMTNEQTRRYSTLLGASSRPLVDRSVAHRKTETQGSARLYSTDGSARKKQAALAEARNFLEAYRSGQVEPLSDIYPKEDAHFATWFAFNAPDKFKQSTVLKPVMLSSEAMKEFDRLAEKKINDSSGGTAELASELRELAASFVRSEAARPENRNLFGVTPETRLSIINRTDLEPETKAVMFAFLGDLKDWGYLKGGDADAPPRFPSLGKSADYARDMLDYFRRSQPNPVEPDGDNFRIISLADNVMPRLHEDRLQAAIENAEKFATETTIANGASTHRPADAFVDRVKKYAEEKFAENSADRISDSVNMWVEFVNENLPEGLPPVSPRRMLQEEEWSKVELVIKTASGEEKASPSTTGEIPASVKRVVEAHAQFAKGGDQWEDFCYQAGGMITAEMENEPLARMAAASSLATAMAHKYLPSDMAVLSTNEGIQDMNVIQDISKDLARRGY